MAPRSGEPGSAPERRFFLARSPAEGRAELLADEARHLRRVLRLAVGDRFIGLDGRGGAWPLSVAGADRDTIELAIEGEGRRDPPPGAPGARLPWIEIALPWPRPGRLEEMLDRLTQLGAAAIVQLACEREGPRAGELSGSRRDRMERVLREACKQSGRTWLPVLADAPSSAPAVLVLLDRDAELSLPEWIDGLRTSGEDLAWTPERPLRVLVGPEGGWTRAEREAWLVRGARPVRLGPHILRLETAAEAAMAILSAELLKPPRT